MTPHTIESAASGRAKCRGCGRAIAKGELRLGERIPNPFADAGLATLWFHLRCGAYKRPEILLEALEATSETVRERETLKTLAECGVEHRRLPRVDGAGKAPTGRARCRSCRETIDRHTWRIGLVYYDEGQFAPSGFIHVACAPAYLGTADVIERIRHFSPELTDDDVAELRQRLEAGPG